MRVRHVFYPWATTSPRTLELFLKGYTGPHKAGLWMNTPSCLNEPEKRVAPPLCDYFSSHVNLCSSVCLCSAKQNLPSLSVNNLQERSAQLCSTILVCSFKVHRQKKKTKNRDTLPRDEETGRETVSWLMDPLTSCEFPDNHIRVSRCGGLSFELWLSVLPKSTCFMC